MKDISIVFPSIRPNNLYKVCKAIDEACKKYTYEVIIISPYNLPPKLDEIYNIKYIKSWASPSVCWQMGTLITNSEFWIDGSDDALFLPNVLDKAIDLYRDNDLQKYDIVSLVLNEGTLDPITLEELPNSKTHQLPDYFFKVSHNIPFHKPCIDLQWQLSLNFLIKTSSLIEIGAFDCGWEYINWGLHDAVLRLQSLGGRVINFPERSLLVAHMPNETFDHGPIHRVQTGKDTIRFNNIYDNLVRVSDRAFLDINAWKNEPQWWKERFG